MILVFGAIRIALSIDAPRLPLPGEQLVGGERRMRPGGRGVAVALAAQRFGVQTQLVGAVGGDAFGDLALDGLRLAGVDVRGVRHLDGQATGLSCVTAVPGCGEAAAVVAQGANAAVQAHWVGDAELGACRSLVVDLELPVAQSCALARRARESGCRTVLLAAPWSRQSVPPGLFDWTLIDLAGLRQAAADSRGPADTVDWALHARRLADQLGGPLLLYLADAGAWTVDADGVRQRRRSLRQATASPATAFDAFAGVFAVAIGQGLSESRAVDHAIAAAALQDPRRGALAMLPDRRAIEDALMREMVAGS